MNSRYVLEVINQYERLQDEAKAAQKLRQEEIYNKFPRIKYIDESIAKIGFNIVSSIFKETDIENFIEQQKRKMTDLKIEKAEILVSNKYPVDYLEIKYRCTKCKDTGYLGSQKCSCFKQKLINKYYQQSNLKDILIKENFDTFDIRLYSTEKFDNKDLSPRENMQHIYSSCIDYYKNFDDINTNLFFFGSSGLGKTFLTNCIAKELLDSGKVVIYQTASNLVEILRMLKFEENSLNQQVEDILDCDLLIIDDLGTEPNTAYTHSELFNIINTRILRRKKMIISTNLLSNDFTHTYPERIYSRIYGHFTVFEFYGHDIRVKKNISNIHTR